MRTTLTLDHDALAAARRLASGRVVSDLMRRGLAARNDYVSSGNGVPVFSVREDSPLITLADVKRDEDAAE